MRWNYLLLIALLAVSCNGKEEDDSNEVSVAQPSISPNINLRKALLKALIELENEDNKENSSPQEDSNRIVEKASASALSIITNSESGNSTTTSSKPITEKVEEPLILFQKSQAVQQSPITTIEREELDPLNDAEQILTSATSSFTIPNSNSIRPDIESRSINKGVSNFIKHEKPSTREYVRVQSTTVVPTSSTEESESKAEEVQFFSAPLVAAFTVHQDEQGVPKKVESILRPPQGKLEKENQLQRETKPQVTKTEPQLQRIDPQLEFQQKQRILEQEIVRLNQNLKQQQLLNQHQQDILFRQQQEQLRLASNARPFLPIANPTFKPNPVTDKPIVNPANQFAQALPTKSAQNFNADRNNNRSGVTLLSSITYDPLIEAGKLPVNGQILPVKGPINFHTPIIQTAGFQQFHSLPQVTPLVTTLTPIPLTAQPQFILNDQQGKRIFRQELGTSNFINTGFNQITPSFTIQKSVQPVNTQQINPDFNNFALVQPQINRFVAPTVLTAPLQQRFFRSNLESTFRYPQNNNYQLTNLLHNSGAFRNKEPEDINIISKVLALDHSGGGQYSSFNPYLGRK